MHKQLILIRHSYAESASYQTSDFERSLTNRGLAYAQQQGFELKKHITNQVNIISSDALRAKQTTEIIHEALNNNEQIVFENLLYQDYTTQDFINLVVNNAKENNSLIVVGHNPSIANIAYRLCPDFNHSVSPGTIIIIDLQISEWKQLEVNCGKLACIIN